VEPIEIDFSKKRLILMISGCASFGLLSLGLILFIELGYITLIIVSLAFIVFFFAFRLSLKKLIQNKPALVIDNVGIIENSSALSVGRIEWDQIEDIKVQPQLQSLIIEVKKPKYFIDR
jgi:hypothetical protein